MLESPLFSKYYDKPKSSENPMPSERKWFIYSLNIGMTYFLSVLTYIMSFTGTVQYNINTIIYSNNSIYSILTPEPWVQYLQWINQAFLLIPISMYIWKYGNRDTMLKLYDLPPYLIALNLIQIITNLLPYKETLFLGLCVFGNIVMISILIYLFIKMNVLDKKDGWIKRFVIDIPISIYYQSCFINLIFLTNQFIYEANETYIYNEKIFIGLIIILFILNFAVFISTRNIFKGLLFSILMFLYGIYTYEFEHNPNITQDIMFDMRVTISISFILNSLIVSIYTICYCKRKKEIEEQEQEQEQMRNPIQFARII